MFNLPKKAGTIVIAFAVAFLTARLKGPDTLRHRIRVDSMGT